MIFQILPILGICGVQLIGGKHSLGKYQLSRVNLPVSLGNILHLNFGKYGSVYEKIFKEGERQWKITKHF